MLIQRRRAPGKKVMRLERASEIRIEDLVRDQTA
jgi:hypothetical protein